MNERDLAHLARWRRDAPGDTNDKLVQIFSRLEIGKLLDDRGDRVVFFRVDHTAALVLVRVSVADKLLQCFEVLAPRERLVILFDKRDRHVSHSPKRADYTDIPEIL